MSPCPQPLDDILPILDSVAPLVLAEEWDKVGLLVEPKSERLVSQMLLTINLSEAVVREARDAGIDLIIEALLAIAIGNA